MTKQIPLTQGKFALVDDEDYNYLMRWKWCFNCGYAVRRQTRKEAGKGNKTKAVMMHRVIMRTPDGLHTDHVDLNGLNNQKYNLRDATRIQNKANIPARIGGSSKFKGVSWNTKDRVWIACIKIDRKLTYLGRFEIEQHAAVAYDIAALNHHGEFARINFPEFVGRNAGLQ